MSISVVLEQILIIFAYVLIGWCAARAGVLSGKDTPLLSRFVTAVTLPLGILASTTVDAKPADLRNMLIAALLFFGMLVLSTAAEIRVGRRLGFSPQHRAIFSGLCTYPNASFMGIPLCTALMGDWGALYGAAVVAAFNILFFTVQDVLFQPGKKLEWKTFATPLNAATVAAVVMLACGWHLPGTVQKVFSSVGGITTPLALIIMGVMLAQRPLRELFLGRFSYAVVLIRNFFWPLVMLGVLALLHADRTMSLALMVFSAMPSASLTAVFAARYGGEGEISSRAVLLSTLASIVSLPVMLLLAQAVL